MTNKRNMTGDRPVAMMDCCKCGSIKPCSHDGADWICRDCENVAPSGEPDGEQLQPIRVGDRVSFAGHDGCYDTGRVFRIAVKAYSTTVSIKSDRGQTWMRDITRVTRLP